MGLSEFLANLNDKHHWSSSLLIGDEKTQIGHRIFYALEEFKETFQDITYVCVYENYDSGPLIQLQEQALKEFLTMPVRFTEMPPCIVYTKNRIYFSGGDYWRSLGSLPLIPSNKIETEKFKIS